MTTCPKCGGTNAYKCVAQNVCLDCMITWTDWQQERILFLESLLREIEEHLHCNGNSKCDFLGEMFDDLPTYKPAYEAGARRGHRCAAAIAAKWREK